MKEQNSSRFGGAKKLYLFAIFIVCFVAGFAWLSHSMQARNIIFYSDTLSDSTPNDFSNHTINFTLGTDIPAGGILTVTPDSEFSIADSNGSSTFTARNVELLVNGTPRTSSSTGGVNTDEVTINTGSPGSIVYELNPTTGVSDGDVLTLRIGNNTTNSFTGGTTYSSTTGTTTLPYDFGGIKNGSTTGSHTINLSVTGANAYADFVVFLIEEIGFAGDTTETIPPFRFNGAPSGDVGGTTLSVEMSLETDEFADCKFDTTASTSYAAMSTVFESTGLLVHTYLLEGLLNDTTYTYYVRCVDDEGNVNIDDYIITFDILEVPEGEPNTTGSTTGDGTGSGDDGTGVGGDSGGTSGNDGTGSDTTGGGGGSGGSGGGSGGGTGGGGSSGGGGGFESSDAPYRSGDGQVEINGLAFPGSDIVVLVDGQEAETGRANSSGVFSVLVEDIARGPYTFGIYAVDDNDLKSTTFSTTFSVQGARTSNLSNINIMPTILVTPDPVALGGTGVFSGYAIPNAAITIETLSDKSGASKQTFTTVSNGAGVWSYETSFAGFAQGTYKVRAKSEQSGGVETDFSDYTYYGVGEAATSFLTADLNRDGKVNLTDFSILLFHWGSNGGASDPPADINQDGSVSLTDFSIMLFQWTG